jgi:hypothetical protein
METPSRQSTVRPATVLSMPSEEDAKKLREDVLASLSEEAKVRRLAAHPSILQPVFRRSVRPPAYSSFNKAFNKVFFCRRCILTAWLAFGQPDR